MVLAVDAAVTVTTWRAEAVGYVSGSPARAGATVVAGLTRATGATGATDFDVWGADGLGLGAAELVGAVLLGAVLLVVSCARVGVVAEQAVTAMAMAMTNGKRKDRPSTRLGCHAVPMRMRGWVAGFSQRMIVTRLLIGIATQPAVGVPSVTCRKNALPAPWRTGPAFGVL